MTDRKARSAVRSKAALVWTLIPLGFVTGFIIYTANHSDASPVLLVIIAIAGAAVPFTSMLFAASSRHDS